MPHDTYVSSATIHIGTVISIETKVLSSGDALTIVYPNDVRAPGEVISASANEVTIELGNKSWRLRPHAPSDGQVNADMAGPNASFWTVQTSF